MPVGQGTTSWSYQLLVNAQIDPAAAIAYSKLNLAASIVNADIASGAAIVGSKLATGLTGPPGVEVAYNEFMSNATSTATSAATAASIVPSSSVTYDGATAVWIEFFCPYLTHSVSGTIVAVELYDGASDLLSLGWMMAPANSGGEAFFAKRKLTPSAGAHTYTAKLWSGGAGTATANAGTGSAGAVGPGFIRITKA